MMPPRRAPEDVVVIGLQVGKGFLLILSRRHDETPPVETPLSPRRGKDKHRWSTTRTR